MGFLTTVVATSTLPGTLLGSAAAATTAGDRYIVSFVDTATADDVAAARERAVSAGAEISYDYDTALIGFAAYLPDAARTELTADPLVAAIEPDEVMTIDATESTPGEEFYALDRIDERKQPLDGEFKYQATGAGVVAYVIDTGVMASHSEFGGRVQAGKSFTAESAASDCGEGHGTHVAGLLGGKNYGVAKAVMIVPVRVFGCKGAASVSTVIAGIEWATEDHFQRGGPAVANLSAGVVKEDGAGLETAVKKAIAAGITFVTAAGNNSESACNQSPARVPAAITVGAVDSYDRLASFSNYGSCVDILAPGVNITSAGIASDTATIEKNGTSMAAPLVTGAVAAFLQRAPKATPAGVRSALVDAATSGVLSGLQGSPNRLLYFALPAGNQAPKAAAPTVSLPGVGRTVGGSTVPVKVSWTKAKDSDGDDIVAYRLQLSYDGGTSWRTVTLPHADSTSVTVDVHPDSKLRFRLRATDERGTDSSNVKTATMRLALDQQSDGKFSSRWVREGDKELSGGSAKHSSKKGASLTYTFTGTRIRWIGTTDSDGGKALVYLDGKYVGTVDTYSKHRALCQVLFSDSLKSDKHTLKIVVAGKHRSKSGGNRVEADAFVVLG